jgi:nucleotide-binding universal stress UspA family protein
MTTESPRTRLTHVIAATDLSELGDRAVLAGLRLCGLQPKSELHVIAVAFDEGNGVRLPWENESPLYQQADAEQKLQARVQSLLAPEVAAVSANVERINVYLTTGNPAHRVVQLAESIDADLIVCGTHGRTGARRLILGSVAEEVVRRAPCGVLVVRPSDFYRGDKLPQIEPKLQEGQPSLRPFHRAPTHHYVDRSAAASSRVFATW